MKTFEIRTEFSEQVYGIAWITVKAESKEEALKKAENNDFSSVNTVTKHSEELEFNFDEVDITETP